MKNYAGYTLIELLAVIAIIGVLTALGIPTYLSYINSSREATGRADIREIMQAQTTYYVNNGEYATDFASLDLGNLSIDQVTDNYSYQLVASEGNQSVVVNATPQRQDLIGFGARVYTAVNEATGNPNTFTVLCEGEVGSVPEVATVNTDEECPIPSNS